MARATTRPLERPEPRSGAGGGDSFDTGFDPSIDGFAFANRFAWSAEELDAVVELFRDELEPDAAEPEPLVPVDELPAAADDGDEVLPVVTGAILWEGIQDRAEEVIEQITRHAGVSYSLCGGMVAAAADYLLVDWIVPRGIGPDDAPTNDSATGRVLRVYLWRRLIESLELNAATFLQWLAAATLPGDGGTEWLRDRTREHWRHLTDVMTAEGQPVPVGLVGTTTDPTEEQQVLAIGFDDPGDDSGTLYVYDPNRPDVVSRIEFDLRGARLTTTRDDSLRAQPERGPLLGFFVEGYVEGCPPATVAAGLRVEPGCDAVGTPLTSTCDVTNVGYHSSPPFAIALRGDTGDVDVQEAVLAPLDEHAGRTFDATVECHTPGERTIAAVAVLRTASGVEATRTFPSLAPHAPSSVVITANPQLVIEPVRDCVSSAVPAGRTMSCTVAPRSLDWVPPGTTPSYEWEAAGQTGTDATFAFTVPNTPGLAFTVRCRVTAGECSSSGRLTLTPLPSHEADRMIAACTFLNEIRIDRLLPFFDRAGAPDPSPDALLPLVDTLAGAARRFVEAMRPDR